MKSVVAHPLASAHAVSPLSFLPTKCRRQPRLFLESLSPKSREKAMKIDTLEPLVDTQPAFNALVELKSGPKSTKQFLMAKLRETAKNLRDTAKYLEDQLKDLEE
jgi:hypothetical protein